MKKKSKEEVSKSAAAWDEAIISVRDRKGGGRNEEPRPTRQSIEDFEFGKMHGSSDTSALQTALWLQKNRPPSNPREDFDDMKSQLMRPGDDTDYHPWQAGIDERDALIRSGDPMTAERAKTEEWHKRLDEQRKAEARSQALVERWAATGEPTDNGWNGHVTPPRYYRRY